MGNALPRLDVEESCGRHLGAREIRDPAVRRKGKARYALTLSLSQTHCRAALLSAKSRAMTMFVITLILSLIPISEPVRFSAGGD